MEDLFYSNIMEALIVMGLIGVFLELYMRSRDWRGHDWAGSLAFYNNLFYGLFNVAATFLYPYVYYLDGRFSHVSSWTDVLALGVVERHTPLVHFATEIYLYSKLWEFQDIIWVYLSGRKASISFQFWFHHMTTYPLTLLLKHTGALCSFWMIFSNLVAHIFVYLFFAGWRSPLFSSLMTFMGTFQLLVGISSSACALYWRLIAHQPFLVNTLHGELFSFCVYMIYFFLWTFDLLIQRHQRRQIRLQNEIKKK